MDHAMMVPRLSLVWTNEMGNYLVSGFVAYIIEGN